MKKKIIYLLISVILLSFPMYNLIDITQRTTTVTTDVNEKIETGTLILDKLSSYDVQIAEKKVRKAEQDRTMVGTATVSQINATIKNIDSGKTTYRAVFKNVCIVGDSLMNGLEAYNILNSNNLVTQVSASLYHLEENIPTIISMNPRVLILHYGINMISGQQVHIDSFIKSYTTHIKTLQKALPDTRIIVSLLFPVNRSVAKAERFAYVDKYNTALIKMCKSLKVEYLDSSSVLKAHPECYGGDGIHLSKVFYSQYWLRFIIQEMGIIG